MNDCVPVPAEELRLREALQEFIRIDEESGLFAEGNASSDLVLALDAARNVLGLPSPLKLDTTDYCAEEAERQPTSNHDWKGKMR